MEDKALYLFAQFDEKTEETLAGYYTILSRHGFTGRQTKNIPYHFTLGSLGIENKGSLIEKLEKVCSETECIDICLGHIGLFGLNVLFVGPNMNFELLSLQNRFFPDCGYGLTPWTAHATLLIDEPDAVLKALPIVAENFKPMSAQIQSIGLYEFFPARFIMSCGLQDKGRACQS